MHTRRLSEYLFTTIIFLLAFFSVRVLRAQSIDIEAAKKEGRVIVYAAVPPQTMKVINEPFEKKYGIKVEYWRASTTGILERALNEWRVGTAPFDVVEGNKGPQYILKSEGIFAKYQPPSSAKFPKAFLEPDQLLTPWRFNPISIMVNTSLVEKRGSAAQPARFAAAKMERKNHDSRPVAAHHHGAISQRPGQV